MRARSRRPSRSAATTNSSSASGSSSGSHAPHPSGAGTVRVVAGPPGGPGSRAAARHRHGRRRRRRDRSGFVARRARSAERSRRRWTAPRSAASWPRRPVSAPMRKGEVGRQIVGTAAEDVALLHQRGDHARQRRPIDGHHPGEARVHGQAEHRSPERRDRPVVVDGMEVGEQLAGLGERAGGWRVDEAQVVAATPRSEFEREPGEVGLGDLGRAVLGAGAVLDLAPQPVRRARLGSPGASRPLLGRRPTRRHRRQPGHPAAGVEARLAGEAAVDHDADAVDGQRRLGDVGRQHHPATPGPRRRQRSVLLGERQRSGEWEDVDVGSDGVAQQSTRCGGSRRCPGRNTSTSPVCSRSARWTAATTSGSIRFPPPGPGRDGRPPRRRPPAPRPPPDGDRGIQCISTSNMRPSLSTTGASSSVVRPSTSGVADIASSRRSGRIVEATSSASARPRSVVRLRSCTSSKITSTDAGQLRIVLQAAGEHPLGDDFDAGVGADVALVAGLVADEAPTLVPVVSAIRRAAARVARRRGSSITIRWPASHASSSRASGITVVLPAPGGATSTARRCSARAARTAGIASTTGRSGSAGRSGGPEGTGQPSAGEPRKDPGRRGRARGSRSTSRSRRWRRRPLPTRAGSNPAQRQRRRRRRG